jgi:hypothetical protein
MKRLTSSIYQRDSSALLIYQNYKFQSFFSLIALSIAGLVTLLSTGAAMDSTLSGVPAVKSQSVAKVHGEPFSLGYCWITLQALLRLLTRNAKLVIRESS